MAWIENDIDKKNKLFITTLAYCSTSCFFYARNIGKTKERFSLPFRAFPFEFSLNHANHRKEENLNIFK
jgi:hypothetical protein